MLEQGPAKKLVVTVYDTERRGGRATYNVLLDLLNHRGLASATVTCGIAGFSAADAIQAINLTDLTSGIPVRVEVIDTEEAIRRLLPDVYDIVECGVVELQDTQIVKLATPEQQPALQTREAPMKLIGDAKMVQIHIGEDDQWEGVPLYEAVVTRARQLGMAGATVFRGILGYGAHNRLHAHKMLSLSHDAPILVSIIDAEEKVTELLSSIDHMLTAGCLITVSDVKVVNYTYRDESKPADTP